MESSLVHKCRQKAKRALRVRKHIRGSAEKPRLSVFKSNMHLHVQLIDDDKGITLASTSTLAKAFRGTEFGRKNKASGRQLGLEIAKTALKLGAKEVVFDRGPFKYHGVVAAVADGAREGGLKL